MTWERFTSRASGPLTGLLAVAVVIGGLGTGGGGPWVEALLLGVLVVVLARRFGPRLPRRSAPDVWAPVPAFVPAVGHAAASPRPVSWALAGPETRELALSASFGAGIGFLATIAVIFGVVFPEDSGGNLATAVEFLPIFVHPFVGMIVLGAHRARTRSVRDGTEELFASCPTTPATRTSAHLATSLLPTAVVTGFSVLLLLLIRSQLGTAWGGFGARQVAVFAGAVVLAAGGAALGVALARWAPWTIVPVVALVGIAVASITLATRGRPGDQHEPIRQLSTFLGDPEVDLRFTAPPYLAHLLWLLSLTVLVGALALLHDRRTRPVVGVVVVAAVVAAGAAYAATRPIDAGDEARIAAVLNDLASHQECVDAAGLDVCTFEGDGALARHITSVVEPVAAAAPPGTLDGLALRSGAEVDVDALPDGTRALLDERRLDGVIPAVLAVGEDVDEGARLWVGLAAVGALDDRRPGIAENLAGQARGVVALWLATRGAPPLSVEDLTTHDEGPLGDTRPWPDACQAGDAPVQWALTDVDAARALVGVPDERVAGVLADEWERFTDPETTTAELLGALGLPAGETSPRLTALGTC